MSTFPFQPKQVLEISLESRKILLYDSQILFPLERTPPSDAVLTFGIPSSRYYYLSNKNVIIPYPSLSDPQQTARDVAAWLDESELPKIYSLETVDGSEPDIDFFSVLEGRKVVLNFKDDISLQRYLRGFAKLFRDFQTLSSDNERHFALNTPITNTFITEFLSYPINKAADFFQAARLVVSKNINDINRYLMNIGIIHFRAENIINLPDKDMFFYLTHFYGPPIPGNLDAQLIKYKYFKRAQNEVTKDIVIQIAENLPTLNRFQREFDAFFDVLNKNSSYPIEKNFNTSSRVRLFHDFFEYMKLLSPIPNLPTLSLNTIRQLNTINNSRLIEFLSKYSDNVIVGLVGKNIDLSGTRGEFLKSAAQILLRNRNFVLLPQEAELCRNNETIFDADKFSELNHAFIGRGNLANGLDCYDINDLFKTFENNKDSEGTYTFVDPYHQGVNFTVKDLRDFRDAISAGRVPISRDIIDRFNFYINQYELQERSDYQNLLKLRSWVSLSKENRDLMRKLWKIYFEMGMYMRQWKGPGTPYPLLAKETGEERVVGTKEEIEISLNVTGANASFRNIFDKLPQEIQDIIWKLRIYFLDNEGNIVDKGYTLYKRYHETIELPPNHENHFCIRMASGTWTVTGAYFMKQILNEDIEGFDLSTQIEYIS